MHQSSAAHTIIRLNAEHEHVLMLLVYRSASCAYRRKHAQKMKEERRRRRRRDWQVIKSTSSSRISGTVVVICISMPL